MASPSPSGEANAQTLSESLDTESASAPASENETVVEDTSSTAFRLLALPAELRQKILGEVVSFCNMDVTAAEAMAQLPRDPVAKLKTLKKLKRAGVISGKNKKVYAKLRPLFGICSTIREDMGFVEREWLRKRTMNLAEFEHWLDNETEIDSIALSINSEFFLRSPPADYKALVKQHKFEISIRPMDSKRQIERAYYKRWSAAIRRLPLGRFSYIELHDLEEELWKCAKRNDLESCFQPDVADRFRTYLMFRTRSHKISSVVVVGDPRQNRG
ncbi:hypothetical protein IWX90DRAFT_507372 [Phyllosticta citrichinensis]|uniref:Uncharacterized protein n=1 Tax=Phyllosticta citrichinensis TaxID=1130410 RepID=A0ABR1XK49_9PEZI